jgi:hypothetical protein
LPSVNQLYTEFRDRGLEVLLVNFREDPAHVRRTVKDRGYVAPVLLDRSGEVTGNAWGVWGPPTVYLIDRRGRLVGRAVGPRPWQSAAARELITALLDAPAGR